MQWDGYHKAINLFVNIRERLVLIGISFTLEAPLGGLGGQYIDVEAGAEQI